MAAVALVTGMNLKLKAGAPTDQSPPLGATPEWLNGAEQGKGEALAGERKGHPRATLLVAAIRAGLRLQCLRSRVV